MSSYGDDYCGDDDDDEKHVDDDDDDNNITAQLNEGNYRSKCDFGEQSRRGTNNANHWRGRHTP